MEKIVIPLGDGFSLVAEKNMDDSYKEIFIYLYDDREKLIHQDLVIVSEEYNYNDDNEIIPLHGRYSVKVYSDPESEDWNVDHLIYRYEEGE